MNKKSFVYLAVGLLLLSACSVQRGGNLVERIRNGYYPYKVKRYVRPGYVEYGTASWYGRKFQGRRTADGEIYNMFDMTAAHKTLPFNTYVKVINLNNHRSAVVRINDRGPFVGNRIIDLSYAAAKKLGMIGTGTAPVKLIVLNGKVDDNPADEVGDTNSTNQGDSMDTDINTNLDTNLNTDLNTDIDTSLNTDAAIDVPSSLFYIQIGSFKSLANAVRYRDRAARIVNNVHIVKVIISGTVFYRVVVGSFATRNDAASYARRFVAGRFRDFCIIGR